MKKFLFVICGVLLFATSCLSGGNSAGSSSSSYTGRLTVTDSDSGEVTYSDNQAQVTIWIPNIIEPKFDIVFNGIKFSPMMPKLNIEIPGIPFTTSVSEDETTINYLFEGENIIPMVGSTAYEKYKIDRVWGCVGKTVEVNFTMASKDSKVHFTTSTENE